jgi:hypothetical protein
MQEILHLNLLLSFSNYYVLLCPTSDEGFFFFVSQTISWLDTLFVQNYIENEEGNTHSILQLLPENSRGKHQPNLLICTKVLMLFFY